MYRKRKSYKHLLWVKAPGIRLLPTECILGKIRLRNQKELGRGHWPINTIPAHHLSRWHKIKSSLWKVVLVDQQLTGNQRKKARVLKADFWKPWLFVCRFRFGLLYLLVDKSIPRLQFYSLSILLSSLISLTAPLATGVPGPDVPPVALRLWWGANLYSTRENCVSNDSNICAWWSSTTWGR